MDTLNIQILFSTETDKGIYKDAVYFPLEKWPVDQELIEAKKLEKVNAWLASINQIRPQPTAEDIQNEINNIQNQIDELTKKKSELEAQL